MRQGFLVQTDDSRVGYRGDTPPSLADVTAPPALPSGVNEAVWARFISKVNVDGSGCWVWTGSKLPKGYGRFWVSPSRGICYAHRFSYEVFVGPIPEGLCIDHLCRNTSCVNPTHLEAVSVGENVRRGRAGENAVANGSIAKAVAASLKVRRSPEWLANFYSRKTTCPKGHPYDMLDARGSRSCRACRRASDRAYRQRKRKAA